jgi:uncharacterized protein YkwD
MLLLHKQARRIALYAALLLPLPPVVLPAPALAMEAVWQADILFHVNAARAAHRLPPLGWNQRLAETAAAHAADLQRCGKLAHDGCNGSDLPARVVQTGYAYRRVAENLALCACDAAEVVRLWLTSAGHRANLLDPNVSEMGADTRVDVSDIRRNQWVLVLGRQ